MSMSESQSQSSRLVRSRSQSSKTSCFMASFPARDMKVVKHWLCHPCAC